MEAEEALQAVPVEERAVAIAVRVLPHEQQLYKIPPMTPPLEYSWGWILFGT